MLITTTLVSAKYRDLPSRPAKLESSLVPSWCDVTALIISRTQREVLGHLRFITPETLCSCRCSAGVLTRVTRAMDD